MPYASILLRSNDTTPFNKNDVYLIFLTNNKVYCIIFSVTLDRYILLYSISEKQTE